MKAIPGKPENSTSGKKPFNKRKWREEKYSIKAKVKKAAEKEKKNMFMKYRKELRRSGIDVSGKRPFQNRDGGMSSLKKAQLEYKMRQEQKQKRMEELERVRKEKEEAIKAYKEKKAAKFRKLSQKTKKGQPVMKGRIELLLEKIEKNYAPQNTWKEKSEGN